MRPALPLLTVMVAVAVAIAARPIGAVGQFPRGLLASQPKAASCSIETRAVSFGLYNPLVTSDKYAQGEVRYVCHRDLFGPLLRVVIDISPGGSNNYDYRRMSSGTNQLQYNLYLDSNHRNIWGDNSRGTTHYERYLPPSDTLVVVPVYGRLFSLQDVAGGNYSDTLQVSIDF